MDKETLSNYGWIVIATLVLCVMVALASPFGHFIENGIKSTTQGLFDVQQKAMGAASIILPNQNISTGETGSDNAYNIIDGANQMVDTVIPLTFRSNADYDKFEAVKLDGNIVDPSNYTVSEGSTVVTFKDSFIASLENKVYFVEIVSTDGVAKCEFTIEFITFIIDGVSYQAKEGMTWEQWVESEYNTNGCYLYPQPYGSQDIESVYNKQGLALIMYTNGNYNFATSTFTIEQGAVWTIQNTGAGS